MFVACVGETTSTGVVHNCRIGKGRVDDCARHRFVIPVILQTGGSSVRVLEILFVVSCIHVFRSLSRQRSGILLPFVCLRPHTHTHTKSKGRRIRTHASTHTQTSDARDDEIRCLLGFVREAQAPRISERQLHLNRSAVVATDATNMHAWSHAGCPQTCEKWCRSCRSRTVSNILLRAGITLYHTRSRRPRLCPAAPAGFTSYGTMKKKWVNDEIHVLSGYLAQIHVLNRN